MMSDEEIEARVRAMTPTIGARKAGWLAEACRMEVGRESPETLLWGCRYREAARELHDLATAARALVAACSRMEDWGGERVRSAVAALLAVWGEEF